jgi:hypothetical protein
MTRNVLKYLDKNVRFSAKQFCIVKSFLLTVPFEAIKSYFYAGNCHICSRHCSLFEGRSKRKTVVTYCIHCCQIFTMLPNKHFNISEIQCRFSFVRVQIKLQGARNVTWDCAFHVLQEYHIKAIFS